MGIRNAIRIMTKAVGFGVYPHQLSWLLHVPLRRIIMSPQKVANRLNLKKDYEVLEIGPGSGYFSVEVAHRLTKGHLQLYDIQQEMLENAKVRLQAQNLNNIGFTQGNGTKLPFEEQQFDVVFMVAVLGEIADQSACLRSIIRVLKIGGVLSITEHLPDPDFKTLSEVKSLVELQRFQFLSSEGSRWAYTANFMKTNGRLAS